jgi:hypothetical protein
VPKPIRRRTATRTRTCEWMTAQKRTMTPFDWRGFTETIGRLKLSGRELLGRLYFIINLH